jgi:transposase InsO family protein
MKELAQGRYEVPWQKQPYQVSVYKLRRWLAAYRRHGLDGLRQKRRADRGTTKAINPLLAERVVAVKRQCRALSIPELIRSLEDAGEAPAAALKHSTVHRLLARHGLSGRPGRDPGLKAQRLPFSYPLPMDLWVGDVMHGRTPVGDRKVYLIVFLDDASRAMMHAAYAFDEGALSVLQVFRQALLVRGVCKRLYVDHGSAYVDARFVRTCAHLGVHLMHAPVGDGAAKGVVERFFARLRDQFERYLQPEDLVDLSTLNSVLWRWLQSTYHQRPHHGLDGEAPWARFLRLLPQAEHRRLEPDFDFEALWRSRETRTVRRDGTVRLKGHWLEVPPTVRRGPVELRFVAEKLPDDVEVWQQDKKLGLATVVDPQANVTRRRWRPKSGAAAPKSLPLDPLGRARRTWQGKSHTKTPSSSKKGRKE